MTALDQLRAEPTPFRDMSMERWTEALLKVHRRQVRLEDVELRGEAYWLTLEGTLWFVLKTAHEPGAPPKALRIAGLIDQAIQDLTIGTAQ